jgi:signal transduction histidine kinase
VTRNTLLCAGVVACLAVFGVGAEVAAGTPQGLALALADLVVGLLLLGFGTAALARRPASRTGIWMGAAGLAWFLGTLGWPFVALHRGVIVLLLLTYPSGLLPRSWLARAAVLAAVVVSVVPSLSSDDRLTIAVVALVAIAALRLFLGSVGIPRVAAGPALLAALMFVGVVLLTAILRLTATTAERPVLWAYDVVIAALAALLFVDILRPRSSGAVLRGLVVDLGRPGTSSLQGRIARALGDPTLVVGVWDGERRTYLDEAGAPVHQPAEGSGRVATRIEDRDTPLALLIHDEAALSEPELLAPVAAVARTAVANASLERRIREQTSEIAASRRRLVEAADIERGALQETLARGPEQRLKRVSLLLEEAVATGVSPVGWELQQAVDAAIAELRELANGVRPTELEGGLRAALPALAARSTIDVSVDAGVERLPESVESAAYFVCSEALANAAKHADSVSAHVQAAVESGRLYLTISDTGVGGADADGSGLRGLADRVEALSGRLRVESTPGVGTRVLAEIPCC